MDTNKLEEAFQLFDEYNSKDAKMYKWEGVDYPQELFFAQRVFDWVKKLNPNASDALLLASRCQHIGRWEVPRESYPDGKVGYLNWRSNLAVYHADKAAELLRQAGIDEEIINNVQRIVLKKQIKLDEEVQIIENALCLVFLEFEFDGFSKKHGSEKVIRILQKTWGKMSEPGRAEALKLTFSEREAELIKQALA